MIRSRPDITHYTWPASVTVRRIRRTQFSRSARRHTAAGKVRIGSSPSLRSVVVVLSSRRSVDGSRSIISGISAQRRGMRRRETVSRYRASVVSASIRGIEIWRGTHWLDIGLSGFDVMRITYVTRFNVRPHNPRIFKYIRSSPSPRFAFGDRCYQSKSNLYIFVGKSFSMCITNTFFSGKKVLQFIDTSTLFNTRRLAFAPCALCVSLSLRWKRFSVPY